MFKKIFFIFLLSPLFLWGYSDEPYHDTAFIGPSKAFYELVYAQYYTTNHFWNAHGKKLPAFNHFNRQSYRYDCEYAVNHSNSIFFKVGYSTVHETLHRKSQGLEDPELSWQHLCYEDKFSACSIKATAIIPAGSLKSCIRYGKAGAEAKLLYSRYLLPNVWCDLGAAYRCYQGFPSDQIRADASFGWSIFPGIWLLSSTHLDFGLWNGNGKKNLNNICFNPNFRLLTTQVQAILRVWKFVSITIGGFVHVWGQNAGAGEGGYCGLWVVF